MDIENYIRKFKPRFVVVYYTDFPTWRHRFIEISAKTNTEIQHVRVNSAAQPVAFTNYKTIHEADLILLPTDKPHIFKTIKNRWGSNDDLLDIIGNKRRGIKKFKEYINDNN